MAKIDMTNLFLFFFFFYTRMMFFGFFFENISQNLHKNTFISCRSLDMVRRANRDAAFLKNRLHHSMETPLNLCFV